MFQATKSPLGGWRIRLLVALAAIGFATLPSLKKNALAAGEKACLTLDASSDSCPAAATPISVTPNTPFTIRVVFDDGGGGKTAGITIDLTYADGLGNPTCNDEGKTAGFDLLGELAVDTGARTIKADYGNLAGSATDAKFIKCTFPGGAAAAGKTITWNKPPGGSAFLLNDTGDELASATFVDATINIEVPPCTAPTTNGTLQATGKNNAGSPECQLTWTAPAGAGTGQVCALTATPFAITAAGTPIAGSPFASTVLTSTVTQGLVFGTATTFQLVVSHTGGALAPVTATCTPQEGSPPTSTLKVPTSALQGAPLKVTGDFSDTDSTNVTLTLFYKAGTGAVKSVPATKTGRTASAVSGKWEATVPGTDVVAGTQLKFILLTEDDIGLKAVLPTDVTIADFTNNIPTDAAFDKVNCAGANAPCIAGDNITVGDRLAFADTDGDGFGNQPVPSEMPFNPADLNEPAATRPGLDVKFALNAPSKVTARIYTLNGKLIRQLPSSNTDFLPNSCHYLQGCNWDGTDFGDSITDFVPNGLYIINIFAVCNAANEPEGACPAGFKATSVNLTKGIVVMK